MVRECKTKSFFSVGCSYRRNFERYTRMLGDLYGVILPIPKAQGENGRQRLAFIKEFCSGFLECPRQHLWYEATRRLSKDNRMSIGHTLFLFRKVLPSSEPDLKGYAEKMSTPSPAVDPDLLKYVRKQVPKLFPKGWDLVRYPNACLNATLPIKSCAQRGLSKGGARYEALTRKVGWNDHQSYVLETLAREAPLELCPSRLASVETGGKHRIVSSADVEANLFRPLHTAIYSHLSTFPWLLRGDAKPSKFKEFTRVAGEVFVSGDYESATDNINVNLSREILELILENSVSVPKGIKESASQLFNTKLTLPKDSKVYLQESGQLMGNLLSFPLLCLINYLAFRFYSKTKGPDVPVRINGDDIVFRAPAEVYDRWAEGVSRSGLTLSKGKTMVDSRYFTLNSTLFKSSNGRVSLVPFIRASAFGYRKSEGGAETLEGRFYSVAPGFTGRRLSKIRSAWLSENKKYILASDRSITRCLGLRVTKAELIESDLYTRECWYLSFPKGIEVPIPPKRATLDQSRKPEGYSLRTVEHVTKEMEKLQEGLGAAFVACAWSKALLRDSKENEKEWQANVRASARLRWGSETGSGLGTCPRRNRHVDDPCVCKYASQCVEECEECEPLRKECKPVSIPRLSLKKKSRLLHLSARNTYRFLRPRTTDEDIRYAVPRRRCRVWLPTEMGDSLTPLGFCKASLEVHE